VVHAPRPDPAVPVPRPHQPVSAVDRGAERGRDRHGVPERRGLLVAAAPRPGAWPPPAEHLVEAPHPDPGLSAGPQLPPPRVAHQRPQEGAHLRLPQRVGTHLERRRAGRVHRRAERHAEDALAPAGADELRQRVARAVVLRHGPLQCRCHRRRRRRAAVDPGGEGRSGGERRLAVAVPVPVALRERRAALRRGGGDRAVTVAEHALRGAEGACGRGGRLRDARQVQVGGFPLRRGLVVRVHVPAIRLCDFGSDEKAAKEVGLQEDREASAGEVREGRAGPERRHTRCGSGRGRGGAVQGRQP
jgi:hypothetical protein